MENFCEVCNELVTFSQVYFSKNNHRGKVLCAFHQLENINKMYPDKNDKRNKIMTAQLFKIYPGLKKIAED